jgi:hypothetical protein
MISTGHLLIGGAVGVALSLKVAPGLAAPLALGCGVLSHHLLDLIPHTDAETFWPEGQAPVPRKGLVIVVLETLLGLVVTATLFVEQHRTLPFLAGAVGGMLPDLLDGVPLWQQRFRRTRVGGWWHHWHLRLHCGHMAQAWVAGLAVDGLVIGAGLWYLLA